MLSVISGVTLPGKGLRFNSSSRSGLTGARLKSDRLASCSSSSTPKVSGAEAAKVSSGMAWLRCLARPHEGTLQDDGSEHFEQHGHRRDRTQLLDHLHAGVARVLE